VRHAHPGRSSRPITPRNSSDEELRLVAEKGGYVGVYFASFINPGHPWGSEDVANHIDHAIKICGEDHVGIGSDHGVNDVGDIDTAQAYVAKLVAERRARGISVSGEGTPFGTDLLGPNQFRVMADTLSKRGYSPRLMEKIMGQNFLRYAKDVWGA
jgi:membrane dipeptidase